MHQCRNQLGELANDLSQICGLKIKRRTNQLLIAIWDDHALPLADRRAACTTSAAAAAAAGVRGRAAEAEQMHELAVGEGGQRGRAEALPAGRARALGAHHHRARARAGVVLPHRLAVRAAQRPHDGGVAASLDQPAQGALSGGTRRGGSAILVAAKTKLEEMREKEKGGTEKIER